MKRDAYIENKNLRPAIPYREYIIYDNEFVYNITRPYVCCHLTIYQKGEKVMGIAHESSKQRIRSEVTIGEGATVIWEWVKNNFPAKEHIFVQGHNGYYEYVTIQPSYEEDGGAFMGISRMSILHQPKAHWSHAGTIEDVLRVLE